MHTTLVGVCIFVRMDLEELVDILATLRSEESDSAALEVKRASGGWPDSVGPTLSAFANTPGGGTIIFGLDEHDAFAVNGVYDAAACRKALASATRSAVEPPIRHTSQALELDGRPVVVAHIGESETAEKPVRLRSTGKAYLRSHDGDFALSTAEEQAFLANRSAPRRDEAAVPGSVRADLDDGLVDAYLSVCRSTSTTLARFDDEELLFRTGVLSEAGGGPSLAGLLALGRYPQQFFPNLVIQAHVTPGAADPAGTRSGDPRRFDGPIPVMLRDALSWVQRNSGTRVVFGQDGHGRDRPEYPAEAVRELLGNALVHRDLGEHALGLAIGLRLEEENLLISNPGGLFGISRDRLGQEGVTSARNGRLIRICQNVRLDGEQRVCEALATGIPTVLRALRGAQMTPPGFFDQGIGFAVTVPNHALLAPDDLEWLADLGPRSVGMTDIQRHALALMRGGRTWTNGSFRRMFPMDSTDARKELGGLVDRGFVVADGDRGQRIYRIAPTATDEEAGGRGAGNRRIVSAHLQLAEMSLQELAAATGLTRRQVGYAVERLRETGAVEIGEGGRGRPTTYRVVRSSAGT